MSRALKRQVDAGILGDVYFGRSVWHRRCGMPGFGGWFGKKEMAGGGPLIDLGVHRLDLALWLMGYPEPVTVSTWNHPGSERATRENQEFDVEDLAAGFIRFDNGASLVLEAGWAGHVQERELMETRLLGTQGGLVQRNVDGTYQMEAEIYTRSGEELYNLKLDHTLAKPPASHAEFINALADNREPPCTPEEGIKMMKILEGLYRSAEPGRAIRYDG